MNTAARIHVAYIIGILLAVIIGLVTIKWGSIPNLEQLLSFALTLASLLLALIAIGYAIYSSGSLNRVLEGLRGSAKSLEGIASGIATASSALTSHAEELPKLLGGMSKQMQETHSLVRAFSERSIEPAPSATPVLKGPVSGSTFVARGSLLGLLSLYAMLRSFQTKKPFARTKLKEKIVLLSNDYMSGYVTASSVAGFFEGNLHEDVWTVTGFDSSVASILRKEIDTRVGKLAETGKTLFGTAAAQVDAFFTEPA